MAIDKMNNGPSSSPSPAPVTPNRSFQWRPCNFTAYAAFDLNKDLPNEENDRECLRLLALKKFCEVEVFFEYVESDNPSCPLWYYGYITTSPLNSFPHSPEMGLIPVNHILKLGSSDIFEEDVSFLKDVLQISSAWPELMTSTLANAGDLASTYHDLKRNYVEMCEHILKLQTLKHDLKGDYSHRFDEEVKALTYSVDLFNSKLGMGDVLLRDENNRVVSQCDQLSVAYEKLLLRRQALFRRSVPHRIERLSTLSQYQDFMIYTKKCCLLVQLKSLRFSRFGTKPPYWLRISVNLVNNVQQIERLLTMQHEPLMILLPEGRLDECEANEEFDPSSVRDLSTVSCLFKDLEVKIEGGKVKTKIVIYCDLMTQGRSFDTIATTSVPACEIQLTSDDLENGRSSNQFKTGGFKMDYVTVPSEEKSGKNKDKLANAVNQNVTAEGSLVTQFVVGEEEEAVKCFNLKASGSLCAQVAQPVHLKLPPQPGAIRNEVFLKFSKLEYDKPLKDKKKLIARIQLLKASKDDQDTSKVAKVDHYDNLNDCVSVGVGSPRSSMYVSPAMIVPKSTQVYTITLHDVIKLDLGDLPLHEIFVLISLFKDNNDKPETSEVDFFLPLTGKLFQVSTVRTKGVEEIKLQGYNNLKNIEPRSLERLSVTTERKVSVPSSVSKGAKGSATLAVGATDHTMKPCNEHLVVSVCINTSFCTNADRLMSHLTCQVADEKLYQNLCSNLFDTDNFDFTIWVLPHVLLNTLDYLSETNLNNNALAFLLDLLLALDRVNKNQSYLKYLTDEKEGFLKLFRNKKIWRTFLEMTLEKLGAVNGKNCECSGNSCGGTLVPSRDVTPAYTKDEDVPADSSCIDEMKFLSCGHYIWPWIKRSLSLDLISNDSKPNLVLFIEQTSKVTELMELSVRLQTDDYRTLARFATQAWMAFPHMSDGLKHIRRLNLQIESLSTCYDSPNLNNNRHRATFQKIVEAVLGHTVQVLSALRKYYYEFSVFLQKLVRYYHEKANQEIFNFNTSDVNFLLAVFENAGFWLENGSDEDDESLADGTHSEHQIRILCSAVEFIQLISGIDLARMIARGEGNAESNSGNSDLARMVRQLLKLSHEFVVFSENHLSEDFSMLRVQILMAIYRFLYQKDPCKTSIFRILLDKVISPDESGDQYTYVFQLLFKVCHVLMCSQVFRLERFSIPRQNLIKKCIKHADNPDSVAAKDVRIPFVDIRHCLAFLLKSVHDKIMWPLVTSRSEKGHVQPYPLADILHMSLASPEGYTLTCFIEILADVYCLLVKVDSQAYPELIRAVDTFIGFKHKMGEQSYVDRFRAKLTSKIESTNLFDPKDRANESKRIDQVCTIQMKDLLNIRSAAESGLDPDLQILYTSDLLRFYAGSKFYRLDVDLSSNMLFIRYHMRLYTLNMEFGNLTSAAECLIEFVVLLERFDKLALTRPNPVDHLSEEVPAEFYKPGFTTIEMSIELLKKAASLYESQKLYEAADAARDQLSNFYYRKLDYEGIAMNYIHRAELACKIKGISFQEQVEQIVPPAGDGPLTTPFPTGKKGGGKSFFQKMPAGNPESQIILPNIRVIHTRGFNLRFYCVRFGPGQNRSKRFPKVFDGKTFIYSRENLFPPEFESYLQNLFPEMEGLTVEQEVYGKNQMPVDIVYAPLTPQLMLPKRFKLQPFLPSSSHEVEFYKTHAISVFEKRLAVDCVEELKNIEYSDESALQMMAPGERVMPDETARRKLIDQWKKSLKTTATHGMLSTRYKLMDRNLVHETDSEPYPGKCRFQVIKMIQQPVLKYSCELAKTELMGFLQSLCGIYSSYMSYNHNPVKQFEALVPFIDIITKLAAPIQGGLKRQCIAFCSLEEYRMCTRDSAVNDFNRNLQELLKALVIVSKVCEEFVEANKENEKLKDKVLDNLTNAAFQFKMHIAGIFDDGALATEGSHEETMAAVNKFVTQDYLNRIMKTDACIHETEKRFVPVEEQRPVVPKKPAVQNRVLPRGRDHLTVQSVLPRAPSDCSPQRGRTVSEKYPLRGPGFESAEDDPYAS